MLVKQFDIPMVQPGSGSARRIRIERRENETTSLYIELPNGMGWVGIDFPSTNETICVGDFLSEVGSTMFEGLNEAPRL